MERRVSSPTLLGPLLQKDLIMLALLSDDFKMQQPPERNVFMLLHLTVSIGVRGVPPGIESSLDSLTVPEGLPLKVLALPPADSGPSLRRREENWLRG